MSKVESSISLAFCESPATNSAESESDVGREDKKLWIWPLQLNVGANVRVGSFATHRCAMKIGLCPQCPESDGWPSKRRPSRSAIKRHSGPLSKMRSSG